MSGGRRTVVVDGNNVMGSVPDGWWRDRPGAVRRLLGRLQCLARHGGDTLVLVLDVPQADLPAGAHDGVEVCYPRRRGRDAADERILELLDERGLAGADGDPEADDVEVVTSDRGLAAGVADRGVPVVGARAFLARLDRTDC